MTRRELSPSKSKKAAPQVIRISIKEKVRLLILGVFLLSAAIWGAELSMIKGVAYQHARLEAIDLNAKKLTLLTKQKHNRVTVYWTKNTKFEIEKIKVAPSDLRPLMEVVVAKNKSLFGDKILKISAASLPVKSCDNPKSRQEDENCSIK